MTPAERMSRVDALLAVGAGRASAPAAATSVAGAAASAGTAHTRAAAFLLRRALDDELHVYLQTHRPALLRCTTRTKTAWLAQYAGSALAGRYAATWHRLSLACHYHCSVLPPPAEELRGWRDDVAAVLRELQKLPRL